MSGVDVLISRGTKGKADWYYANANPITLVPNIGAGHVDYFCISDYQLTDSENKDEWAKRAATEYGYPQYLFDKASKDGYRWGGHCYKCALIRLGEDDAPYGYTWVLVYNDNGTIRRLSFDSLQRSGDAVWGYEVYFMSHLWGNFTTDNALGGALPGTVFYGGIPAFNNDEVINGKTGEERAEEYLLDDGDGNNWADYGAYAPGSDIPASNDDDNVSEDIDGLGGSDSYSDSNSSIISNGVLGQDGMIKSAKLDGSDYKALGTLIGKGWLAGNIGQGVVNIKLLRTPGVLPVGEHQRIIDASGTFHDYAVSGYPINSQYISYNVGSFTFNEQFGNFLDYSPYTDIKIYLPYCGLQSLDAQTVVGKTINVKCVIDILSGNLVYYLFTKTSGGQTCLYSWNGNCSIEIPISADDYGRKVSAGINAGTTALATLMKPGLGAVASIASTGINYAQNSSQHMIMGNLSANNGFGGIQYPYLVISRPNPKIPSNFGHTTGYLSMKNMTLGDCKGFTKVQDVHLHGINGATQEELNEISSLLKQGVVL